MIQFCLVARCGLLITRSWLALLEEKNVIFVTNFRSKEDLKYILPNTRKLDTVNVDLVLLPVDSIGCLRQRVGLTMGCKSSSWSNPDYDIRMVMWKDWGDVIAFGFGYMLKVMIETNVTAWNAVPVTAPCLLLSLSYLFSLHYSFLTYIVWMC